MKPHEPRAYGVDLGRGRRATRPVTTTAYQPSLLLEPYFRASPIGRSLSHKHKNQARELRENIRVENGRMVVTSVVVTCGQKM